jgi:O-Antigen ligase
MPMTIWGYIFLLVGMVAMFSPKWLYRLLIFWTLFSATAFANFGQEDTGSALQVWMFLGVLWLLRLFAGSAFSFSFAVDRRILPPCTLLAAFLLIAAFSLAMPIYIDGSLVIASPILGDNSETPLRFTSHNFTQLLYLAFGVIIAICVAQRNLREDYRRETERILMYAGIFVAGWGLFQFFCNTTGFSYPDFIFNNSNSPYAKGFLQTLDSTDVGRISSVCLEPSVFAQGLVTLLPLTLPAWLKRGAAISTTVDRLSSILFVVALLLSTSSTAYLALVLAFFLLGLVLIRTKIISRAQSVGLVVAVVVLGAGAAAVLFATVTSMSNIVSAALLSKGSSGSAIERLMTIQYAFGYFQRYPVLGIGWGSATSHDLIVLLLSNVGILGATVFLVAMFYIVRSNWQLISSLDTPLNLSRAVWFQSLTIFFITGIIVGFPLVFGNFWVILGMGVAMTWNGMPLQRGMASVSTTVGPEGSSAPSLA